MVVVVLGVYLSVLFPLLLVRRRFLTILSDRRLLHRAAPISRKVSELALADVTQVHGIAEGSWLPVQVENAEGKFVRFEGKDLGRAVAQAAGLPLPSRPAATAEKVAGVLYLADSWGQFLTLNAAFLAWFFWLGQIKAVSESSPVAVVVICALLLSVLIIGFIAGRIMGPIVAIRWLRRTVTVDEMRAAIRLLVERGFLLRADDDCRRFQPIILRMASRIYGQPITPPNAGGDALAQ